MELEEGRESFLRDIDGLQELPGGLEVPVNQRIRHAVAGMREVLSNIPCKDLPASQDSAEMHRVNRGLAGELQLLEIHAEQRALVAQVPEEIDHGREALEGPVPVDAVNGLSRDVALFVLLDQERVDGLDEQQVEFEEEDCLGKGTQGNSVAALVFATAGHGGRHSLRCFVRY